MLIRPVLKTETDSPKVILPGCADFPFHIRMSLLLGVFLSAIINHILYSKFLYSLPAHLVGLQQLVVHYKPSSHLSQLNGIIKEQLTLCFNFLYYHYDLNLWKRVSSGSVNSGGNALL